MFQGAGRNATTWSIGDLSGWDTSNVTDMINMFDFAGYNATTWNIGDIGGWDTGNVTRMSRMFYSAGYNAVTWDIGDIRAWNVAKVWTHASFIRINATGTNASVVNNQPNWPN